MPSGGESILVIHDGGPASLVACLICPDPALATAWFSPLASPAQASRLNSAQRQVDLLGLDSLVTAPRSDAAASGRKPPLAVSRMLLQAAAEGVARGCSRVVWPVHAGADLDSAADAADLELQLTRAIAIDAPGPTTPPRFDTPLLDLTDSQLAELGRDLDAPFESAWWCQRDGSAPCGGCAECTRWRTALARLGAPRTVAAPLG